MSVRAAVLLAALAAFPTSRAYADASFVIRAQGDVFDDPMRVSPEGGNPGTTLGAQRKAVMEYVVGLWSTRIDSPIPIVVEVAARTEGCARNSLVLASARSNDFFSGIRTLGADPDLWYPSALADRLAGKDLAPGVADIKIYINRSVDDECRGMFGGFYHGFDARPHGGRQDLAETLLHELAHGLGFTANIDLDTGMSRKAGIDVFSAQIYDLAARKSWREMSSLERQASARNVRGLSFAGANTTRTAASLLARGTPRLQLMPALAGFVGAVAETGASYPAFAGPVRLAGTFQGCASSSTGLSGALVLIRPDCLSTELQPRLAAANAAGVLLAFDRGYSQPALPTFVTSDAGTLPSLVVSPADAELMRSALAAGPLHARADWDTTRMVGADAEGRALLFATQPANTGSSVSHFEPLARPDLLMEPYNRRVASHDLDLTIPVMLDLGWVTLCGNRQLDLGEECDDGDGNSDSAPSACRERCVRATCGDGVVDDGEGCDQGTNNSNAPNACRTGCLKAHCGDGVVDTGETCDRGKDNSDAVPNACRTDCRPARCGDRVVDMAEQCDGAEGCSLSCTFLPPMPVVPPMPAAEPASAPEPVDEPIDDVKSDGPAPVWVEDLPDDGPSRRRSKGDCALVPGFAANRGDLGFALCGLFALLARRRSGRHARNAS